MPKKKTAQLNGIAASGIAGLDQILGGGFPRNHIYFVGGETGSGKTTLGLHFVLEGARRGEKVLFVTLAETENELKAVARSHGWKFGNVNVYEFSIVSNDLSSAEQYTIFHPSEIELTDSVKTILGEIEGLEPDRVVIDAISELRLMEPSSLRYRRQIMQLKHFFSKRKCTVLIMEEQDSKDVPAFSLAHGIILLEQQQRSFGVTQRRLNVLKLRGVNYQSGYHEFKIETGGIKVYPRLLPSGDMRPGTKSVRSMITSKITELDKLLGGGLTRGTSTLILGPAGSGKSSLAMQYAEAVAERGEHVKFYVCDKSIQTLLQRAAGFEMDIENHSKAGRIDIQRIDPSEIGVGEFSNQLKHSVEHNKTRMVIIDSLNGFLHAMLEERLLELHMNNILAYLGSQGVTTLLVMAQHGLISSETKPPANLSYLADSVLLLRFFEVQGEIRRALSVIKKRSGDHERTIRELQMSSTGLAVGKSLTEFKGVLSNPLEYIGTEL